MRGFEGDIHQIYDCLIAFEVFEYLSESESNIKTMIEIEDTIIFLTHLYDKGMNYPKRDKMVILSARGRAACLFLQSIDIGNDCQKVSCQLLYDK